MSMMMMMMIIPVIFKCKKFTIQKTFENKETKFKFKIQAAAHVNDDVDASNNSSNSDGILEYVLQNMYYIYYSVYYRIYMLIYITE